MQQWERGLGRVLGIGASAVVAGAAAGAVGAALAGTALARQAVTPTEPESPVRVTAVGQGERGTVVRLRGEDADLPGRYSLLFDGGSGHARLGPVIGAGVGGVTREVVRVDRGRLRPGELGRITGWWYTAPEEVGARVERISYATELGEADAWVVHPRRA
ncbi:MAG: hypothetical protein QM606_10910, partial [Leucobacter sp.]